MKSLFKKLYIIVITLIITCSTVMINTTLIKTFAASFTDVTSSYYYWDAINWGVNNGIIQGFSDGTFRPDVYVTRQQFVIMLWRYAGKPSASVTINFTDVNTSTTGYKAIQWAVSEGLVVGYNDGTFRPTENVTRASAAIIIWRYAGRPTVQIMKYANTMCYDISSSNSAFKAVNWSTRYNIFEAIKSGLYIVFSPNSYCTRAIAINSLYKYDNYCNRGSTVTRAKISNGWVTIHCQADIIKKISLTSYYDGEIRSESQFTTVKNLATTLKNAVDSLGINNGMSVSTAYNKIVTWVCNTANYDENGYNHHWYNLINGSAVCEGYAECIKLMCEMCGIDCKYISGHVGTVGHAWNRVYLNNTWYYTDITWYDRSGGSSNYLSVSFWNDSRVQDYISDAIPSY